MLQLVGCGTTHTPDARAADVVALVEVDLNEFAEAATVVVAQRLGIAKRLQDGVSLSREQGRQQIEGLPLGVCTCIGLLEQDPW
jgi:hypothetical protein